MSKLWSGCRWDGGTQSKAGMRGLPKILGSSVDLWLKKTLYKEQRQHERKEEKGRKATGKEINIPHSNSFVCSSINQRKPLCSSIVVAELVNARSRVLSESVGLTLLLCFQSGFLHSWRLALNQWPKLRVSPTLAPVTTRYSLWVPDKCGHKCYPSLFRSNRALAGFGGREPQIRGECKTICSLSGF